MSSLFQPLANPLSRLLTDPGLGGGANLVVNGAFDTDLTGWVEVEGGTATIVQNAGKAQFNADGSFNLQLRQDVAVVAGRTYTLRYTIGGAALAVSIGSVSSGTQYFTGTQTPGDYVRSILATTNLISLTFGRQSASTPTLDSVSIR